jgi:hypothetical protein
MTRNDLIALAIVATAACFIVWVVTGAVAG